MGTDSPRRLFRAAMTSAPGTALRFPMSVRNAASREITSPMPTFRCLSHSPPPQCCGRPSRVIACSPSRGELDYPPTTTTSKLDIVARDRGILTRTLAKRTGSSRPLARTYAADTGRAQDRGCATGTPTESYCFPLVFFQIGLRYSFDATLSTLLITGRNNSTRALKTPRYFLNGRAKPSRRPWAPSQI